jgi:hypothetical protein
MGDYKPCPMSRLEIAAREVNAARRLLQDVLKLPDTAKNKAALVEAAREALHKAQARKDRISAGE